MIRFLVALSILLASTPAHANCEYRGLLNAKTTIDREFRDSPLVVRARPVAADYHWSGVDESWTIYRLRVVEIFKGRVPSRLSLFTYRDSGGFYLDADRDAVPNLDRDYLLFLNPPARRSSVPLAAKQAWLINYSCGRSGRWDRINSSDRQRLNRLKARP